MRSVSVVVCTRDRPAALAACLRSLSDEPADEILVVDNGSSLPVRADRVRVVVEPRPGVAHARNLALTEATSEIVLFVDDDVTVRPGLVAAHRAAYGTDVVAAGGPIRLAATGPRPRWLDPTLEELLSVIDRGPADRDVEDADLPYGANLSVDRDAARRAGGFDVALGRRGDHLASGEESKLLRHLVATGGRVRWIAAAEVDHHVSSERLRLRWFLRRAWAQGATDVHAGERPAERALALRLLWTALRPGGTPWPADGPPPLAARCAVELVRRTRLLGAAVALARG
jgi:glycosyltransferase involved in cell wall biosynthesis